MKNLSLYGFFSSQFLGFMDGMSPSNIKYVAECLASMLFSNFLPVVINQGNSIITHCISTFCSRARGGSVEIMKLYNGFDRYCNNYFIYCGLSMHFPEVVHDCLSLRLSSRLTFREPGYYRS